MNNTFKCQRCSGTKLDHEKLVTARANVETHDGEGHVEYGEFQIVEEATEYCLHCHYVCRDCGWRLHIGEYGIELESDLMYYRSKFYDDIAAANEAYFAEMDEKAEEDELDMAAKYDAYLETKG